MSNKAYSKILIVDDDASIGNLLARWLKEEGYDCQTATSAKKALELLENDNFSLLVTDINMPGMTGIELQRAVHERFKDLAVIMVTAVDDRNIALSALELGAYGYVIKPFERIEVLINVANAMRLHELEMKNRIHCEELEQLVSERTGKLEQAYAELKSSHEQILQQEKLASIGQLAAGVAHEINNPTGFIASNLGALTRYIDRFYELIQAQSEIIESLEGGDAAAEMNTLRKKLKFDFIVEDTKDLISESLEGTDRIKKIVQGLKNFSRTDQDAQSSTNINECLESTINVVWNELKYKAVLEKDYGDLPLTKCYPQQLSQVFMNLLVNAAHSIEEQGEISIKTWLAANHIFITISDNGCGIPEENMGKLFEAFFTTKEIGKGTGLGLSIVNDIIKKHHGKITVESEVGKGTTFTVKIPVVEE